MTTHKRGRLLSIFGNSQEPQPENKQEKFFYEQIAMLAGAGGFSVDFVEKTTYFDKQLRKIIEVPTSYEPSFKHVLHFFDMDFHEAIQQDYKKVQTGVSYQDDVKIVSYKNRTFWARIIAKPVIDKKGNVTGVKGVVMDIDEERKKEQSLAKSLELIEANNNRLFKFANYVSQDLKSQVNNLELTSQLVDERRLVGDHKDLFKNYQEIAKSLSRTVSQLNEVVSIQNRANDKREVIILEELLAECVGELQHLINKEEAYVYSDFSEVPSVEYIPDFLHNIFYTLIKNGILNQNTARKPEIKAYSITEDGKDKIIIEDNGGGMDMKKDADRIFHMTKSSDSEGYNQSVGLFVVKNQVEAMGGVINVMSKLGYGTKFIITL
ncbi:MAG: hypothetical protein CL868_12010 [Cytophagaceae bacterium]|nr:hypothetical protein [Cytophagaceae bacterium]|tara:strand:- start:17755 stop:18891 length:1137 start_codon:yes stop_codon:yes gene_type:complete